MAVENLNAKEKILQATIEVLTEVEDAEGITVRQIAKRARVGIGSINYHFRSKENLLNEAVGRMMGDQAAQWFVPSDETGVDPVSRLKMLLRDTANVAFRHPKLSRIAISHALLQGNMETSQLILPVLREIFGKTRDEIALRLLAFQLITTTQVIFLRAAAFRLYAGVNIFDERQREELFDILVNSLIDHQEEVQ